MRRRIKGINPAIQTISLEHPFVGWGDWVSPPYPEPDGYSDISDETGHSFWQECLHFRCSFYPTGSIGGLAPHGDHTGLSSSSQHRFTTDDAGAFCKEALEASKDGGYSDWVAHLYETFTDQFPDQFSIVNSLIELKHGIKEFIPSMQDLRERISSNYLKIQFGIAPFLRDLVDCCTVGDKFRSRLKFLHENRVFFVDRKGRESEDSLLGDRMVNEYDPVFQPPSDYTVIPPLVQPAVHHPLRTNFEEEWSKAKHVATAIISNEMEGLDDVWLQGAAMRGMAGLSNPLQVAWNAVPWTWMADWFIDIDTMLEPFEIQPFAGQLNLQRAFLSSRVRVKGQVFTVCQTLDEGYGEPGELLFRSYERSKELEVQQGFISPRLVVPSLSGTQTAVILALIDQRSKAIPDIVSLYKKYKGRK